MQKPAEFEIRYEDSDKYEAELRRLNGDSMSVDPAITATTEDAPTFWAAVDLAKTRGRQHQTTVYVYKVIGLRELPDAAIPWLHTWEWDDIVCIADVTDGKVDVYPED